MQFSQEVDCPSIYQETQLTLKVKMTKSPLKNAPNCNDSDDKSEINVKKSNSPSIPENHNTNENVDGLHVVPPINTQEKNKVSAITEKFAAIDKNDSHKRSIFKIKKGQIIEFTIENIPYKVEVLSLK